ncbi:hypothetical protein Pelo_13608 [Pelomyxa schiedti]|nr:hypothetical protein Pelo_13608 [Pelomyxa schiedti]
MSGTTKEKVLLVSDAVAADLFKIFDADHDGRATPAEIGTVLGLPPHDPLLRNFIDHLDTDGNGVLSFVELLHGLEYLLNIYEIKPDFSSPEKFMDSFMPAFKNTPPPRAPSHSTHCIGARSQSLAHMQSLDDGIPALDISAIPAAVKEVRSDIPDVRNKDVHLKRYISSKRRACKWISECLSCPVPTVDQLKDGILLCELVNKIKPKAVPQISKSRSIPSSLENMLLFLNACRDMGVPDGALCSPSDFVFKKNLDIAFGTVVRLGALVSDTAFETKLPVERDTIVTSEDMSEAKRELELVDTNCEAEIIRAFVSHQSRPPVTQTDTTNKSALKTTSTENKKKPANDLLIKGSSTRDTTGATSGVKKETTSRDNRSRAEHISTSLSPDSNEKRTADDSRIKVEIPATQSREPHFTKALHSGSCHHPVSMCDATTLEKEYAARLNRLGASLQNLETKNRELETQNFVLLGQLKQMKGESTRPKSKSVMTEGMYIRKLDLLSKEMTALSEKFEQSETRNKSLTAELVSSKRELAALTKPFMMNLEGPSPPTTSRSTTVTTTRTTTTTATSISTTSSASEPTKANSTS